MLSPKRIKLRNTPFTSRRHLAICKSQIVRPFFVLLLVFTINIGHSQSYTIDWSDYLIEQYDCGLSGTTGAAASYDDLDHEALTFGDTKVSLSHGPDENIYCASGKIRSKNGGMTHVYSATLDGATKEDCSWMIIEFSQPVSNVSFDLIDVDLALLNNWQDELTFSPTWSTLDNNSNLDVDKSNSRITGTTNCDSEITDCNSLITFEGPLTRIKIDYCYGSGTTDNFPDRQIYNLGDITFDRYEINPNISIDENCPGSPSILHLKDQIVNENEILEIVYGNADNMVSNTIQYATPGIYNLDLEKTYDSCGDFPVVIRIIDDPAIAASQGEMITSLSNSDLYTFEIIDNEAPTFPADQQDIMYLSCDEEIPVAYNRPARDNCLEPIDIEQEVWEEYLDFNEDCTQWNVRRYWQISDLCGNRSIDSIDYVFVYDENLRGLGDAEDLIEACNVFSPNGDGINDYFAIYLGNLNIATSEFYVFDRSGNPRYQEKNILGERVETNLGGDLRYGPWQSGVYIWMLRLTDTYGNTKVISREVTILL